MTTAASAERAGGIRAALSYRDYRWLVSGLAISSVGIWAYNVALYVYVWEATQSPTWAAAVTLGRFIPALLFSTYGGVIAERIERRRLMITADVVCALVMLTMAVVTGLGAYPLAVIMLASISSIIGTIYYPATAALVPQIVEERDLAGANAFNSVVENVATIIGPGLGAIILAVSNVQVALLVNACAFLVSAFCTTRLATRSRPSDVTEGGSAGVFRQVTLGFKALASSTTATVLVLASVLGSVIFGADTVLFVVVSDRVLGLGPDGFGWLMAGLGVGGILMSTVVNRLAGAPRLATVISLALVAYTLPTGLLLIVDVPVVAVALQVVRGAGLLVVEVLAVTAIQRALPSDMIARVFGVFVTLTLVAYSLGALIVPTLLALVGLNGTLLAVSAGASLLVVALYPFTQRVDRALTDRLAQLGPRIETLSALGIFAAANRPALERLAATATEEHAPAGSRIIVEGEQADAFFVITDGSVAIMAAGEGGSEERVSVLGPGEYFGEIGLLEEGPRTASVDALTDVALLRIPGGDFIAALAETTPSPVFMETTRTRLAAVRPARELTARALTRNED